MQSMRELTELVQREEVVAEAARDSHMARSLTTLLASTTDSSKLDAISALLASLSGSSVHTSRLVTCAYAAGIVVKVSECALKEGVGSRLWGISHTFNLFLINELAEFIDGASVLELGSGVGSTGAVLSITCCTAALSLRNRPFLMPYAVCSREISCRCRCIQVGCQAGYADGSH